MRNITQASRRSHWPGQGLILTAFGIAEKIVGQDLARQIERFSLHIYEEASVFASERGIIIADTKFEFGVDESTAPPSVVLIDEVLTPDSSRFWSAEKYEMGRSQDSFDKQYLRGQMIIAQSPRPADFLNRLACPDITKGEERSYYARRYHCEHFRSIQTIV